MSEINDVLRRSPGGVFTFALGFPFAVALIGWVALGGFVGGSSSSVVAVESGPGEVVAVIPTATPLVPIVSPTPTPSERPADTTGTDLDDPTVSPSSSLKPVPIVSPTPTPSERPADTTGTDLADPAVSAKPTIKPTPKPSVIPKPSTTPKPSVKPTLQPKPVKTEKPVKSATAVLDGWVSPTIPVDQIVSLSKPRLSSGVPVTVNVSGCDRSKGCTFANGDLFLNRNEGSGRVVVTWSAPATPEYKSWSASSAVSY